MHKTERTAVRKDMFGAARAAVFMAVCVAHGALSAGAADYYNVPSPTSYEGYGSSSISGAGSSTGWSDTPGGSRPPQSARDWNSQESEKATDSTPLISGP